MADNFFPDKNVLKSMIQYAAGPLVRVDWINDPQSFYGFAGLDASGAPIAGMPSSPPATDPTASGLAVNATLRVTSWVDVAWDDTTRTLGMSDVTAHGTAPPTIALGGTVANTGVENIDVKVTTAGARGVWLGAWSRDLRVTWTAFTSAAEVTMANTGMKLEISSGDASLDNTWDASPMQIVINKGLRHFTLEVRVETDGPNVWAIAERIRAYVYLKSTLALLPANRLAVRSIRPMVDLSNQTRWDNKATNTAIIEIEMTYAMEIYDRAASQPGNWIETVNTNNKVPFVPSE